MICRRSSFKHLLTSTARCERYKACEYEPAGSGVYLCFNLLKLSLVIPGGELMFTSAKLGYVRQGYSVTLMNNAISTPSLSIR